MKLDFPIDVGRGVFGLGVQRVRKFGYNGDIDTTFETVWDGGGTYPFPTAAAAVRIKAGGHAEDTAAGVGAQAVVVAGLDENWEYCEETIVTKGATVSDPTTATFIRIFRCYVSVAGAYGGTNTGAITIETAAASILAIISASNAQTQMCIYSIPVGMTGYLTAISLEVESLKLVTIKIMRRADADDVTAPSYSPARLVSQFGKQGEHMHHRYEQVPAPFHERSDIYVEAKQDSVGGTTILSCEFTMVLVDDAHRFTQNGAVC